MQIYLDRIIRAAKLDVNLYEEVEADKGAMSQAMGVSSSPGLLRILAIIPGIGGIIFMIVSVWMLVAMVIAVRQALDYQSTLRAVGVCIIGWIIQTIILMILFTVLGVGS